MSQTEKQCDQTMKFGQFIEYNMRNIFLEKPYKKCGGEASPRNVIQLFLLHVQVEVYQNILKPSC